MRKYFCAGLATLALACGSAGESSVSGDPGSGGLSGGSNLDVSHAGTGGGGPKCTRVETISALAIERPEPFDVVIVADHSGSLSWSRDSLSAGLKNLLAYAHGQQVRFFVLTPTQYGASSEAAKSGGGSLVVWKDPVTNKPYSHAITEYKQVCTDINKAPFDCAKRDQMQGKGISVKGTWEFQMPEPIAAITPDMTAAQITEQQQKIADGILALGSDGAQTEQPICTLNRYIAQNAALLPKHAVFMILSDEDDKSTPDECLLSYSYQEHEDGKNDAPCTENCDVYRFEALYMHTDESVEYDCVPVDDKGVHHPENGLHYSASSSAGPLCELGSVKSCGDFEFGLINEFCKGDYVPENCVAKCNGDAGSGYYCSLDRTSASPDLCTTSFSLNGTTYGNFPDYCQKKYNDGPFKDCTSGGYKLGVSPRYLGDDVITPVVDVPTLADMGSHFRSSADTAFGKDEYFVESIVLDPAFNCPVNAGQSYGTTLKGLATSNTDVYALCNDYAPALQRIQTFAKRLVKNEFPLELAEDEEVDAVNAVDVDGKRRELAKSEFQFDRAQNLLVVTPGVLGPSDLTLDLTVADSCIEIVR